MQQAETVTEVKTVTPQALGTRLHISPRKVRSILRAEYPRDVKNKRWEIPETLARKVERVYKAKVKEREAKKQAVIQKELAGDR